ncbi:MAG TPA: prohibitin family protein [Terriglobales bacterium]|nr:prohibitin family protein [Terriglobales bacterium]
MTDFGSQRGRVIDASAVVQKASRLGLTFFGAIFLLILLWASVARVPTGHVGVLTMFGRVTGTVLPEGLHLANPLAVNNVMSIRTQEIKETASVPSNEGLIITMDTSLLFHLDPDKAADVYRRLGPRFDSVVVEPNLRSAIREATASNSANALYTSEREKVSTAIITQLKRDLEPRGVIVEAVLLRDIQLPAALKQSIETKQQAEQESLAMSFRLQKEKQEADRKRIEAAGIRDFQQIVAQGISPALLEWKGIEATEKLADSKNAKVVVIGGGKNGLPLILGQ